MDFDELAGAVVVDLSHPLTAEMPMFPTSPPFAMIPNVRLGDHIDEDGYSGCNEIVVMSSHAGTHLDAPGHIASHGRTIAGSRPMASVQDGQHGLIEGSIAHVRPIVGRGVLVDAPALLGIDSLPAEGVVDVGLLKAHAEQTGVSVRPGDTVLIRTGWSRTWGDTATYVGAHGPTPGLDLDGARWLADRGAAVLGADNGTVEATRPGWSGLPVHTALLAERGVLLLENMALEDLAATGATTFAFVCSPLAIAGASGSPVRPIAVLS